VDVIFVTISPSTAATLLVHATGRIRAGGLSQTDAEGRAQALIEEAFPASLLGGACPDKTALQKDEATNQQGSFKPSFI